MSKADMERKIERLRKVIAEQEKDEAEWCAWPESAMLDLEFVKERAVGLSVVDEGSLLETVETASDKDVVRAASSALSAAAGGMPAHTSVGVWPRSRLRSHYSPFNVYSQIRLHLLQRRAGVLAARKSEDFVDTIKDLDELLEQLSGKGGPSAAAGGKAADGADGADAAAAAAAAASLLPRAAVLGVRSILTFLTDAVAADEPNVALLVSAMHTLQATLDGFAPQALQHEDSELLQLAAETLTTVSQRDSLSDEVKAAALSTLISLVMAWGRPGVVLDAAHTLLNAKLGEGVRLTAPGTLQRLTAYSKGAKGTLTAPSAAALTSSIPLEERARGADGAAALASVASDGSYLYLHNDAGLHKLGSGYTDTKLGKLAASRPGFNKGAFLSMALAPPSLYFRTPDMDAGMLGILEADDLSDRGVLLQKRVPAAGGDESKREDGDVPLVPALGEHPFRFLPSPVAAHVAALEQRGDSLAEYYLRTFNSQDVMAEVSSVKLDWPPLAEQARVETWGESTWDADFGNHLLGASLHGDVDGAMGPRPATFVEAVGADDWAFFRAADGSVFFAGAGAGIGVRGASARTMTPMPYPPLEGMQIAAMACGTNAAHALFVAKSGQVLVVGPAEGTELAGKRGKAAKSPRFVSDIDTAVHAATAEQISAIVLASGEVRTFGRNGDYCQLGHSAGSTGHCEAAAVPGFGADRKATRVALGLGHALVLTDDGSVWAWGRNNDGQCGNGDDSGSPVEEPTRVDLPGAAVDIQAGSEHSAVLLADGTVVTFGANGAGQLGHGDQEASAVPKAMVGIDGAVKQVHIGENQTVVLTVDGRVFWAGVDRDDGGDKVVAAAERPLSATGTAAAIGAAQSKAFIFAAAPPLTARAMHSLTVSASKTVLTVLLPASAIGAAGPRVVSRSFSTKTGVHLGDGEGEWTTGDAVATFDAVNGLLWEHSPSAATVSRYEARPGSAGGKKRPFSGLDMLYEPAFALPTAALAPVKPVQVAVSLLGVLDTLLAKMESGKDDDAADGSSAGGEGDKKAAKKGKRRAGLASGEPESTGMRHERVQQGWGFGGSKDCICFTVDTDIELCGIGIWGGSGRFSGDLYITEGNTGVSGGKEKLAEMAFDFASPPDKTPEIVLFDEPPLIEAGQEYQISTKVAGSNGYYGENAPSVIATDAGVEFRFSNTVESGQNGTNFARGRIPIIYFRLPFHGEARTLLSEEEAADELAPLELDASLLCTGLDRAGFTRLLSMVDWAKRALLSGDAAAVSLPGSGEHSAAFILVSALRLLVVNLTNPAHRSQFSGPDGPSAYATFLAETDSALQELVFALVSAAPAVARTVGSLFCDLFDVLYPTWTLKMRCMRSLLSSVRDSSNAGLELILGRVLEALSRRDNVASLCFPYLASAKSGGQGSSAASRAAGPPLDERTVALLEELHSQESKEDDDDSSDDLFSVFLSLLTSPSRDALAALAAGTGSGGEVTLDGQPPYVLGVAQLLVKIQSELMDIIPAPMPAGGAVAPECTITRFGGFNGVGWGYWGTPDGVAFQVSEDVLLTGYGVWGGSGDYKVDMYVRRGESTEAGEQLGLTSTEYSCRDSTPAPIYFDEPVYISAGEWYCALVKITGPNTHSGNTASPSVTGDDGVTFTFKNASGNNNGTNASGGQMPQFMYRRARGGGAASKKDDSEDSKSAVDARNELEASPSVRSFLEYLGSVLDEVERFLKGVTESPLVAGGGSSSAGDEELEGLRALIRSHPIIQELLPTLLAHVGLLATGTPIVARSLLPRLVSLLNLVDSMNHVLVEDDDGDDSGAYEAVTVESQHPYPFSSQQEWQVDFPSDVNYMVLEFDPRCESEQAGDVLTLYTDSTRSTRVLGAYTGHARGDKPTTTWPTVPLFVPGNKLVFVMSSVGEPEKSVSDCWGFAVSVHGVRLESPKLAPLNHMALEMSHITGVCMSALLMQPDGESWEQLRKVLSSAVFRHGLQPLGDSVSAAELQFLNDFVDVADGTEGGRLAAWLGEEREIEPEEPLPDAGVDDAKEPEFKLDGLLEWDPAASHKDVRISGLSVNSNDTTHHKYAVFGVGFDSGVVAWEYRHDKDVDGDEATCFGACVKPVEPFDNYTTNKNMWLVRAYNGYKYNRGRQDGTTERFKQGDRIRIEYNAAEGTLRYFKNGRDIGVLFRDVRGKVFPALAFYYNDRTTTLDRLEVDGHVVIDSAPEGAIGKAAGSSSSDVWDRDNTSGEVTIREDGKVINSGPGRGTTHSLLSRGISSGKLAWEMALEKDVHGDEATCFGVASRPVADSKYNAAGKWMLRCYNGEYYASGARAGTTDKIHQGDRVRCELDMDAGSLRYYVNGRDLGVLFTGLSGTLYPAVCFYFDNRQVRLLSVEGGDASVSSVDIDSPAVKTALRRSFAAMLWHLDVVGDAARASAVIEELGDTLGDSGTAVTAGDMEALDAESSEAAAAEAAGDGAGEGEGEGDAAGEGEGEDDSVSEKKPLKTPDVLKRLAWLYRGHQESLLASLESDEHAVMKLEAERDFPLTGSSKAGPATSGESLAYGSIIEDDVRNFYYEVEITAIGEVITLGFIPVGQEGFRGHLGWHGGTFGYHSDDGQFYNSGHAVGPTYGKGDVIGVGWNRKKKNIYFTKNGRHLGVVYKGISRAAKMRPAMTATAGGIITINWGATEFQYKPSNEFRSTGEKTKAASPHSVSGLNDKSALLLRMPKAACDAPPPEEESKVELSEKPSIAELIPALLAMRDSKDPHRASARLRSARRSDITGSMRLFFSSDLTSDAVQAQLESSKQLGSTLLTVFKRVNSLLHSLHDLDAKVELLWFLAATLHVVPATEEAAKPDEATLGPHFLSTVAGCTVEDKEAIRAVFYELLTTMASFIDNPPAGRRGRALRTLALRCWSLQFEEADYPFLHESGVFNKLRGLMSAGAGAEESKAADDVVGPQLSTVADVHDGGVLTVSSNDERKAGLTDDSVDSYWECSYDDEEKWKWITWASACGEDGKASTQPCGVSIYIDNKRDADNGASEVQLAFGSNLDELRDGPSRKLAGSYQGWVSFPLPAGTGAVRISLTTRGRTVRVRGLRVVARAPYVAGPTSTADISVQALRVFKALSSQVFGAMMAGLKKNSADEEEAAPPKAKGWGLIRKKMPTLRRQKSSEGVAEMREHLAGVLFEFGGEGVSGLQAHLFQAVVDELSAETARFAEHRVWEIATDDNDQDASCFELASMLVSLSGSDTGKAFIAQPSVLTTLLQLFPIATPRIQSTLLTAFRRVLPMVDLPSMADLAAGDAEGAAGLVHYLLLVFAKSLNLQLRGRVAGKPLREEVPLSQSWLAGVVSGDVAAQWLAMLRSLRATPTWEEAFKAVAREHVTELPQTLKVHEASPMEATKLTQLWLALASLAVIGEDHSVLADVESLAESKAEEAATVVRREPKMCDNHDDGKTVAAWYCPKLDMNLCDDCDYFMHLPKDLRDVKRVDIKPTEVEHPQVDFHEGCARMKLSWLMVLVDVTGSKAVLEFRKASSRRQEASEEEASESL